MATCRPSRELSAELLLEPCSESDTLPLADEPALEADEARLSAWAKPLAPRASRSNEAGMIRRRGRWKVMLGQGGRVDIPWGWYLKGGLD